MPKTTTKLHTLVLGALLLSACGAQPAPTPLAGTPAAGTVPAAVTPTAGSISFMVFGDPAELRAYQVLVAATLTGANANDITQLLALLDAVPPVRVKFGRPRRRPKRVQGDRA
jgi:hypothetical protein